MLIRNIVNKRRGQAILMVTLALIAMFGILGLAVDLGYSFFVRKAARTAADAAALSAVRAAFNVAGTTGPYTCGATGVTCAPTPITCPASPSGTDNLTVGCQYAVQNGFYEGGNAGSQHVSLTANDTTPFPTATGNVAVQYWVTAEASQTIPQLFSAVLGNPTATVRVTATAAIVQVEVPGSLILLGRQYDRTAMKSPPGGGLQYGINVWVQANDNGGLKALQTRGGIRMASECGDATLGYGNDHCSNGGNKNIKAGTNWGNGTVSSPSTRIRLGGWYDMSNGGVWTAAPTNGTSTGFGDPMEGKNQPMMAGFDQTLPLKPVPGGIINSTVCPTGTCTPGRYFAVNTDSCGATIRQRASFDPLQISGDITFSGSGLGKYVFYGGLKSGSGNGNTARFNPGVYVYAGVRPLSNAPGSLIDTSTNFNMLDATIAPGPNSDAGELFIMTDGTYGGRIPFPLADGVGIGNNNTNCLPLVFDTTAAASNLPFGTANFQSGNNGTRVNLHGLNPDHQDVLDAGLDAYAPTLMWWDRDNSSVKHTADGHVDFSSACGGSSENQPCTNTLLDNGSPELKLQASPSLSLYGVVYQPRGTWTSTLAGGGYSGPIQLITGAIEVKANATLDLRIPQNVTTVNIATLIE
ncbi:MAG: hypothetical protein JJE04_21355 [Acidobacteriia bacterium]|nr:hypothetical protein [Terriglobia bacterium]